MKRAPYGVRKLIRDLESAYMDERPIWMQGALEIKNYQGLAIRSAYYLRRLLSASRPTTSEEGK